MEEKQLIFKLSQILSSNNDPYRRNNIDLTKEITKPTNPKRNSVVKAFLGLIPERTYRKCINLYLNEKRKKAVLSKREQTDLLRTLVKMESHSEKLI